MGVRVIVVFVKGNVLIARCTMFSHEDTTWEELRPESLLPEAVTAHKDSSAAPLALLVGYEAT